MNATELALGTRKLPRVAVLGVGAIGTVLAGALEGKADVFLCRRGRLAPMKLRDAAGERTVRATVWASPEDATQVDWVIVATKAQDISDAGAWLDRMIGGRTRVVVAQNGVDHAARVRRWVDPSRVVPSTVFIAAERVEPDTVVVTQTTGITLPNSSHARDFAALVGPMVPVELRDDFAATSWTKVVMNAALNSITALTDRPAAVLRQPAAQDLCLSALREGVAVAAGVGIDLSSGAEDILKHLLQLPAAAVPSMLKDLRAGRATERAYLTGALIEAGQQHGVATPTLLVLDHLLQVLELRRDLLGEYAAYRGCVCGSCSPSPGWCRGGTMPAGAGAVDVVPQVVVF